MKKAVWLQETKVMRFEDALSAWTEKRLTQEEAAALLGVCPRSFRRYVDRCHEDGVDGLIDRRMSQVSSRRAPVDEVARMEALYKERYDGWVGGALPRALPGDARRGAVVHVDEEPAAGGRPGVEGARRGEAPQEAGVGADGGSAWCIGTARRTAGWRTRRGIWS